MPTCQCLCWSCFLVVFFWLKVSLALHQPIPSVLCYGEDSDSVHMVASPLHIFSLCRLMSSDGANAFVSHSFSQAVPLSTVVFLILVDRKLFLLPPFPACPWQAYFLHSVCVGLCAQVCGHARICVCACVSLSLCMCVCTYVCILQ